MKYLFSLNGRAFFLLGGFLLLIGGNLLAQTVSKGYLVTQESDTLRGRYKMGNTGVTFITKDRRELPIMFTQLLDFGKVDKKGWYSLYYERSSSKSSELYFMAYVNKYEELTFAPYNAQYRLTQAEKDNQTHIRLWYKDKAQLFAEGPVIPSYSDLPYFDHPTRLGTWKYYYPDGSPKAEIRYQGGQANGFFQSWFENGHSMFKGSFDNQKPNLLWKAWNDEGEEIAGFGDFVKKYWENSGLDTLETSMVYEDLESELNRFVKKLSAGEPIEPPKRQNANANGPRAQNMIPVQKSIGYPQIAIDAGLQGAVILRVLVDETGAIIRHRVIDGVHPILLSAVEDKIQQLTFTTVKVDGELIKFWVNIPFNFKLI